MAKPVKVLSIDGGGIRGIIPAMILNEIERRTGKRIAQLFDLIAGTSTGGILALGLSIPGDGDDPKYSASRMLELYEREGNRIFSRSVWHRLHAVGNLAEEKYSAAGLEDVLDEYFGTARLKDSMTDILVTSYEIERRTPWFFKSQNSKAKPDYDFPVKQVARATSAAPTYFEPIKIPAVQGSDYYALIDGGVFANNPAMCAYVEARTLHPGLNDFLVVSLGTGELTRPLPYEEVIGWGLAKWAQPILNVVFDGVNDTTDYQLRQLLPASNDRQRYYRFQARLNEGNDDLDDTSRTNLRVLRLLADDMIRLRGDDLTGLCEQLMA